MRDDKTPQDANEGSMGPSRSTAGLGAWRPIETAPKDGTRILLVMPRGNGRHEDLVTIGYWHQPGNAALKGFWTASGSSSRLSSHWMPLPGAPNEAELRGIAPRKE